MQQKNLIIDTDIGDDIDDAMALSFVLGRPELNLLGVPTVYRNTVQRARQAKLLLNLAGRGDVPVYAGTGMPYKEKTAVTEPLCQYTEALEEECCNYENPEDGTEGTGAVDFLIQMAQRYGKELSILSVGPMTNLAKAVEKAPEVMATVGECMIMGGCFSTEYAEWNILCDPEAAQIVLTSDMPVTCVGADITERCKLSKEEQDRILQDNSTPLRAYLGEILQLWLTTSGRDAAVLHDPLAASALLEKNQLTYEKQDICVRTDGRCADGKSMRGMTVRADQWGLNPGEHHLIQVACDVDEKAFKRLYLETVYS